MNNTKSRETVKHTPATLETKALSWLIDYDKQRKPSGVQDCSIQGPKGAWLSGVPYLWTQFPERAFVFASLADANTFCRKFSKLSRGGMRVTAINGLDWLTFPKNYPAPCGCEFRFDNDGLVRWQQCPIHANAEDVLKACKELLAYAKAISCKGDNVEKKQAKLAIAKAEGRTL